MVVTRINGGLGNQMFQYAAGRSLALLNKTPLILDISFFENNETKQEHEKIILSRIFPRINAMMLPKNGNALLITKILKEKYFLQQKYAEIRRIVGLPPTLVYVMEDKLLTYQTNFHSNKSPFLYLRGDWQNEKYFQPFKSIILQDLSFPSIKNDALNSDILGKINRTNSVSVHIRRGDYISSAIHQPASIGYYHKAIERISKLIPNPTFFVFSDAIDWCKANLDIHQANYINHNTGNESYVDMHLMSFCKHNIIANSSFSWWGAWLNQNKNKIVISPEVWLENFNIKATNIVPNDWILI